MLHYTSHGGRIAHLPFAPGIEEQVAGDRSYYVATDIRAFDGADMVGAFRHKPGVCLVMTRFGLGFMIIYSRDDLLPAGTEIIEA